MTATNASPELLRDLEELDTQWARDDLLEFIQEVNPNFKVNFHHEIVCNRLTRLRHEKGQRIIITLPPQYGKSEMVSRCLPAWILGHFPHGKIILASYGTSLARSFNKDCQAIMETETYLRIFPDTLIRPHAPRGFARSSIFMETSRRGYLYTVGVGGSTTGRTANPLLIVDDPFKDWQEANSPDRRTKVKEWFDSVIQTRLSLNANVVVMHTRWHEDDLAGKLLAKASEDSEATQWEIINFPAVVEDMAELHPEDPRKMGEALWPNHKGDEAFLRKLAKDIGSFIFAALFQQRPRSTGGNIINPKWWRTYKRLPEDCEEFILSVDCAFKDFDTSDYVVIQLWARRGIEKYIIDQARDHMDVIKTCDAILNMLLKYDGDYDINTVYVEDKANGSAVIQLLKKKISGLLPVEPEGSKVSRVYAVSPQIEAGNVYVPHEDVAKFPVGNFIAEWSKFPLGTNDDQVDAGSQALDQLSKNENHYLRQLLKKKGK